MAVLPAMPVPRSLLAPLALAAVFAARSAPPATPDAVLAAAPAGDWAEADPADLLQLELAGGRRVVVLLAPAFAPAHVAAIRALARAHWYDGIAVERVQDDYVAQWGDPDGRRALPAAVPPRPPAEYSRPAAGLPLVRLPYRDTFAPEAGASGAFPVARDGAEAWAVHCYGMVGVGRELSPDTGSGAELYAVIGHAPRALDRNVAIVGRVVAGIEALSALPRGTGPLGFYADPAQRVGVVRVRLASELPPPTRPHAAWLRPESASYARWVAARAHRSDGFFGRPADAIDLCNALPPVRVFTGR